MTDPLLVLSDGEFGADLLMDAAAVGEDYTTEDLTLVRVYRDGDCLREVDTDAFVRRLRGPGDTALGEVPPDADSSEERFSPLLLTDVPPEFVTLDGPDDETVLTRVMALNVEIDKLALVVKVAAALADAPDGRGDVAEAEALLDQLEELQDVDGVEALIRRRLF